MEKNSQSDPSSHDPLGRKRSQIGLEVALSILICLTSFLGNLLVVYVVHKDSRLKSLTNVFIHNLALTDISMASLHMPFWVTSLYTGTWIFSEKWCKFQAVIQSTSGKKCFHPDYGTYRLQPIFPSRQTRTVQQGLL